MFLYDNIKEQYGESGMQRIQTILEKYSHVFAKGRYDFGNVNDIIYHFGIRPEKRNEVVYAKQFPLGPKARLAYMYDVFKKTEAGIYEEDENSPHNIAVLMIKKKTMLVF